MAKMFREERNGKKEVDRFIFILFFVGKAGPDPALHLSRCGDDTAAYPHAFGERSVEKQIGCRLMTLPFLCRLTGKLPPVCLVCFLNVFVAFVSSFSLSGLH